MAAVAVSAIYCLWQQYHQSEIKRQRTLHERVAYMLWMAAHLDDGPAYAASVSRCCQQ
jgi:hypothetical protein